VIKLERTTYLLERPNGKERGGKKKNQTFLQTKGPNHHSAGQGSSENFKGGEKKGGGVDATPVEGGEKLGQQEWRSGVLRGERQGKEKKKRTTRGNRVLLLRAKQGEQTKTSTKKKKEGIPHRATNHCLPHSDENDRGNPDDHQGR